MLSLRVSRDKRGYDYIYLLLEARRRGRVENRLLYCGRWPTPCRVGMRPFDDETRARLEEAHPDVAFDWPALLKTLQAALGVSRPATAGPPPPPARPPRRSGGPTPPQYGGRPGQVRRPGGPGAPRPTEPLEPLMPADEREADYVSGEVVLVSAEIEEREVSYVAPEFEPVDEADRAYAAAIDLELVTDEIVHLPVSGQSESQGRGPASSESSSATAGASEAGERADALDNDGGDAEADADGDADADPTVAAQTGAAPGAGGERPAEVAGENARPHRRRRRRGGRGRGKPPDVRQGSE